MRVVNVKKPCHFYRLLGSFVNMKLAKNNDNDKVQKVYKSKMLSLVKILLMNWKCIVVLQYMLQHVCYIVKDNV